MTDQEQAGTDQQGASGQSPPGGIPAGLSGQEASDIQDRLEAQPEQEPGTPGLSLEQRVQRLESHLGLDRVYVHDVEDEGQQ